MTSTNYYHGERPEIAPFLPSNYKTVIEVGCGEGNFSKNLRPGCEIWACEPNALAAREAEKKLTKVFVGRYEAIASKLPHEYFDLVICNDVIEHMTDHDWFFDSIVTKVKPSAVLVGSVPNIRHIRALIHLILKKDWQYKDSMAFDRTHLRFFTQKSLLRTFDTHGFVVEKFVGINGTKGALNHFVLFIFNLITFWQHSDIEHFQFAFRVRRGKLPHRSLS